MKFMLDTNSLDFIYDNDLIHSVNELVKNGSIDLLVTHVQLDEIEKITDNKKKERIKTILYTQVVASCGFSGTDESTSRGYVGARLDAFTLISEEDTKLFDNIKRRLTSTHPLGNAADITIAFTAFKKNVEYLVSNDSGIHNVLKEFTFTVKGITNDEFYEILKKIKL